MKTPPCRNRDSHCISNISCYDDRHIRLLRSCLFHTDGTRALQGFLPSPYTFCIEFLHREDFRIWLCYMQRGCFPQSSVRKRRYAPEQVRRLFRLFQPAFPASDPAGHTLYQRLYCQTLQGERAGMNFQNPHTCVCGKVFSARRYGHSEVRG